MPGLQESLAASVAKAVAVTKKQVARTLRKAFRIEMSGYKQLVRSQNRFRNGLGWGAIRSARAAQRKLSAARQMRLGLEMQCEADAREKRNRLNTASKEFRKTWGVPRRKNGSNASD